MKASAILLLASLSALAACQDLTQPAAPADNAEKQVTTAARTIQVAPPTGVWEVDRANILTAIAAARGGDVIQFAAGRYAVYPTEGFASWIPVAVPNVTLRGHPDGTTLIGLEEPDDPYTFPLGFMLGRPRQTVRNLEFLGFYIAVYAGGSAPFPRGIGGFGITASTFRNTIYGVVASTITRDGTVIAGNEFVNTGYPFWFSGRYARIRGNLIHAPEPERVPLLGRPHNAGVVSNSEGRCDDNLIEDNRVTGSRTASSSSRGARSEGPAAAT